VYTCGAEGYILDCGLVFGGLGGEEDIVDGFCERGFGANGGWQQGGTEGRRRRCIWWKIGVAAEEEMSMPQETHAGDSRPQVSRLVHKHASCEIGRYPHAGYGALEAVCGWLSSGTARINADAPRRTVPPALGRGGDANRCSGS